jgi:hypothetical protein
MRWNGTKFGQDWKVELKKSSIIYCWILLKDLMKVGLNFAHFVWTNFKVSLAQFGKIFCGVFPVLNETWWYSTKFNKFLWY